MKARALWALLLSPASLALQPVPRAWADDVTVAKDTIRLDLRTVYCYSNEEDGCKEGTFRVFPKIDLEINGALPSGSQPWIEFAGFGQTVKFDAYLEEAWGKENRWKVGAGGGENTANSIRVPGKTDPGTLTFTIGMRNELMETKSTLYEGTFHVLKSWVDPKNEETAEFHVDDDWRLPIGYLYMEPDRGLHVVTWYRGRPGGVKTYLFKDGKEVGKNEVCGIGDENDFDPGMWIWWEVDCELVGVYGDAETAANGYEPNYDLSANPGEYEVKCLAAGKLARVVKFTVKGDGSFDNGLASSNQLGSPRVMVPVQVKMDNPAWNKEAWKTGAFYGHPLTGFALPE